MTDLDTYRSMAAQGVTVEEVAVTVIQDGGAQFLTVTFIINLFGLELSPAVDVMRKA